MLELMSKLSSHLSSYYYWFTFIRPQAAGQGTARTT